VLGKKEHTVTKKGRTSCIFDHILFFEFKALTKEEVQAAVIKVGPCTFGVCVLGCRGVGARRESCRLSV
jgi:hypothetical protein